MFRNGKEEYLNTLQRIFVYSDEQLLQTRSAFIDEDLLSRLSAKELIWLSENFRSMQWDVYACNTSDWNIDFGRERFLHLRDGQYDAMLKLGTFMANGYGRQWCTEKISGMDGALPFLVLRMNDWVAPIRERSFELASQRADVCSVREIFSALPMIEKVEYSGRRDMDRVRAFRDQITQALRQKLCLTADEVLDAIHDQEIFVKNAIYRFVNQNKVLSQEQMERLLRLEKTGYGKRLLLLGMFRHYGCDTERLGEYLASKSSVVRYHALLYRYEMEQGAWEGLEKMLLDPSKRIRGYACYILTRRTGTDITAYYLQELERRVSGTVLLGIGENGTKQEIEMIVPFLEDFDERIRKAALIAYGNLAAESGDAVYWRFLSGGNLVLARQAYRLIRKYRIPYPAADLYQGLRLNQEKASGECFLKLLLCAPSWQRLPYLLQLYCDAGLPDEWHRMILKKISYRNPYAKLSRQQADEICDILRQYEHQIPREISEGIRFDLRYVTK